MRLRINNPTPSTENLCTKCSHYTEMKGIENQQLRRCGVLRTELPFVVAECNQFVDKSAPQLWDMQQIAWAIATDKKSGKIGFYSPSSLKKAVDEGKVDQPPHLPDLD